MTGSGVHRIWIGKLPAGEFFLDLQQIRWTSMSFETMAFLNLPESEFEVASSDSPHYIGSFFMYGSGLESTDDEAPIYAERRFVLGRNLIERVGMEDGNYVVFISNDLSGQRLLMQPFRFEAFLVTEK